MHLALHPEIAERKEKSAPERRRMLSKMTNDEQEATQVMTKMGVASTRAVIDARKFPLKKAGARAVWPGPEWWE